MNEKNIEQARFDALFARKTTDDLTEGEDNQYNSGDGMTAIVEDTSPELGGDLQLNGFGFAGQVETPDFVLDGGLI